MDEESSDDDGMYISSPLAGVDISRANLGSFVRSRDQFQEEEAEPSNEPEAAQEDAEEKKNKKVKWIWGYLGKMGEFNKAFKSRVFLMKPDGKLRYYDPGEDEKTVNVTTLKDPLGIIPLLKSSVCEIDRSVYGRVKDSFLFGVTPEDSQRMYVLEAPSKNKRDLWLQVMTLAGAIKTDRVETPRVVPDSLAEGWLEKMGKKETANGWKTRYFAVRPGKLSYYKDLKAATKGSSSGEILLTADSTLNMEEDLVLGKSYCFSLTYKGRKYIISTSDPEDKEFWCGLMGNCKKS